MEGAVDDLGGLVAQVADLVGPGVVEAGRGLGFAGLALEYGFAFEAPSFAWCRMAFEGVDEPVEFEKPRVEREPSTVG